jgi:RDD family protein
MYCTQCGTPSDVGIIFCQKCGAALLPPVALTESREQPESSVPQVRPWARYWARMFDLSLFGVIAAILIGIFFPAVFSEKGSDAGLQLLVPFVWIFVESLLLSVFGTSPGKVLFKTRLHLTGSDSIPFIFALHRSLRVWWRGLGAGVAIVAFFTLSHAHTVLTRDSVTSWDRELGFVVGHEKIGATRIVFAVLWFGAMFALAIFSAVMDVSQSSY